MKKSNSIDKSSSTTTTALTSTSTCAPSLKESSDSISEAPNNKDSLEYLSGESLSPDKEPSYIPPVDIHRLANYFLPVAIPTMITIVLVCIFVNLVCSLEPDVCYEGVISHRWHIPRTDQFGSVEQKEQSFGAKVQNAAMFTLYIVACITVATFIYALIYYLKLKWFVTCQDMLGVAIFMSIGTFALLKIFFIAFNIAFDWFTAAFVIWNVALTALSIFFLKDSPKILRQAYLILLAVMSSLLFIILLSPITTWFLLAALVLWDLFAVLAPCGPLRWILEIIHKQKKNKESNAMELSPIDAYSTMLYQVNMSTKQDKPEVDQSNRDEDTQDKHKPVKEQKFCGCEGPCKKAGERSSKLGMGDFIFYSVLVGKTWVITRQLLAVLLVTLAIQIGLLCTNLWQVIKRKPLPALPFSLTIALLVLLVFQYAVSPFANKLNVHMIHI